MPGRRQLPLAAAQLVEVPGGEVSEPEALQHGSHLVQVGGPQPPPSGRLVLCDEDRLENRQGGGVRQALRQVTDQAGALDW